MLGPGNIADSWWVGRCGASRGIFLQHEGAVGGGWAALGGGAELGADK